MQSAFILWRRLDRPGHEVARVIEHVVGPTVEGTAAFAERGQPCRIDYHIACDAAWRTLSAKITGWHGERAIAMDITGGFTLALGLACLALMPAAAPINQGAWGSLKKALLVLVFPGLVDFFLVFYGGQRAAHEAQCEPGDT